MKTLQVSYFRRMPAAKVWPPAQHRSWSYSRHRAPAHELDLWLLRQPFLTKRVISQIQQPACARDDVSILHLKVDATDIDTAFADLEDDRVFAFGILCE